MAEVRQKSFTSNRNYEADLGIAEGLNRHTLREIKKTNIPLFTFDEHNQTGNSFGEKLENAFSSIFNQGFNHVIAVGNDTPSLQAKHILTAKEGLECSRADIILGPATDGGAWLIGFTDTAFYSGTFSELAWNSDQLLHSIFREYHSSHQINLLDYFDDLDNEADIRGFLESSVNEAHLAELYRLVLSLYSEKPFSCSSFYAVQKHEEVNFNFSLRAPPFPSDFYSSI